MLILTPEYTILQKHAADYEQKHRCHDKETEKIDVIQYIQKILHLSAKRKLK